jgi:tetratricopeptide (TPR) repeat protein
VSQLLNGHYQLIKVLGSNSLGQTYLVRDTQIPQHPERVIRHLQLSNQTPRTLKFVMALLRKKAESLTKLSHYDQTPKILDCFEHENSFYLVEEFIAGRPLEDALLPGEPLPEHQVVQLLREILDVLVLVHGWGLVHRCIKPSSLIRRQSDGKLVLTGFGIFRELSAQMLQPSSEPLSYQKNGASVYLSPEQPQQRQVQFNTDLYAVGMIGIQALTGLSTTELIDLPNGGYRHADSFSWHEQAKVSPALASILNKMIHPDSKQRYQTATEVLDDLGKIKVVKGAAAPSPLGAPLLQQKTNTIHSGTHGSFKPWLMVLAIAAALAALLLAQVPQALLARYLTQQGEQQARQNLNDQAIASYTQAIRAHPSSSAYYNRALAALSREDQQSALQDLSQAIELDSKYKEAYYQRANLRFELGDNQGALADYTQAIRLDPNYISAYVNRGSVRAELSDEQGAVDDYTLAIQLDPNLAAAYLNRCLSRSNLGEHRAAIADCTQAINLQPSSVLAYQNRGLVRRRIGDVAGAIEDFNISIRLDPNDPDPYYNRGLARMDLGDRPGAIADYTEALQRDPQHVFAYYDRGLARVEAGDIEGAIADFQQSATLCLDSGRMGCYQDAQYQLEQLQAPTLPSADLPG